MSDPFCAILEALDGSPAVGDVPRVEQAIRWRLVLGGFADRHLAFDRFGSGDGLHGGEDGDLAGLLGEARSVDVPLAYLYDREHTERMHRGGSGGGAGLTVPAWLNTVRTLFPKEAVQVMEQDALTRYGLEELVTDPEILRRSEPSQALLKAILQFKHLMTPPVLDVAREIVAAVIAELRGQLETTCRPALHGPIRPVGRSPLRTFRNVNWARTIRRNLKNFDPTRQRLVADRIDFDHRQRRRSAWRIIIAVDQSGSMTDSLIHAAVMAAIFAGLPALSVHLVLWDHRLLDVSHLVDDPLEVLLSCQLGGGTRLLAAMEHCANLITAPQRTIFCLLSDWHLGGEAKDCLAMAHTLAEAGVTGIGLSALDADCQPVFDERFARQLSGTGWFVAALTPRKLAEHVGRIIAE